MEDALLLRHENRLREQQHQQQHHPQDGNEAKTFLAFARALRDYLVAVAEVPSDSSGHAASAVKETGAAETVTPEWLLTSCAKLPSCEIMGGALQLALAVVSACSKGNETEVQAALFDTIGSDDVAMELLFEITPLANDIKRNISPDDLRRCVGGSAVGESAHISSTGDVDMEHRRLLKEEAMEALDIAAMAKAAVSVDVRQGATHVVTSASDKRNLKIAKKAAKRAAIAVAAARAAGVIIDDGDENSGFDKDQLKSEAAIIGNRWKGLHGMTDEEVWEMQRNLLPEGTRVYHEGNRMDKLPPGTTREYGEGYEMVTVPAAVKDPSELCPRIKLAEVMTPDMCKAFAGTNSLNPMQSEVFDAAFHTQENLLICAPTGAGKTNVAMLTVVAHFREKGILRNQNDPYASYQSIGVDTSQFDGGKKVIYIAPMKALAQEVVEKFSSKLKPLKIIVRELTGDMQLNRAEADAADIIVTTPEKWDVVTRKGGDGSLSQACGLLIIDEVHLLADERGAVIESVVARLHRLVESSQCQVRIVGLSATLPNYKDVARFLRVDEHRGLFYFGPKHRPVPLQQRFIGVTETKDRFRREKQMNDVCYEIVLDSLQRGYQVMVFVHSRKGTGQTATALAEEATKKGDLERWFLTIGSESNGDAHTRYADKAAKSRNRELSQHFNNGMGIHHAGMLRNDRKMTEQMFSDGAIKVLCCTATLAWGINLPAHTVVIKGTEVYNAEKGCTIDLSILDVMQIFGRAGRPQFDTSGEATLITSHDGLARYLDRLVREVPIESSFIKQLADHLNAEVVSGTVTNIPEATEWLAYTYLYVRMCNNPLAYGVSQDQKEDDPMLRGRCLDLVVEAARRLDDLRMLRYHQESGNLAVASLGRVASHYYIRAESVATFNEMLERNTNPSDADLCYLICCAYEFENVKVRNEELDEMDSLKKKACPLVVKAPVEEFSGKCCVLLQAFISNARVTSFTLISDTNYIASNAGRVARALFEICLKSGKSAASVKLLRLAKSIDKRVWWFHSPLRQFPGEVQGNVFNALESRKIGAEFGYNSYDAALSLLDMLPQEVGQLCHWKRGGTKVQRLVKMLPRVEISCNVQPVTSSILRFRVHLQPLFDWNGRWHGGAQGFWIWVEDSGSVDGRVYHHEYVLFSRRTHPEPMDLEMNIPAFDPLPAQYFIRIVSDSWVGCETVLPVSFKHILVPARKMPFTDLLDLTPLPITALNEKKFEQLYSSKFETFNPIQTQLFHVLYHTDTPVLLGAPTGSGKTIVAELTLLRMKRNQPKSKCVYIAPLKSLARERLKEWRSRFGSPPFNWSVLELSGDTHHDSRALNKADVLVCTPEKWDLITRGWRGTTDDISNTSPASNGKRFVKEVGLLIIDEIHLLGESRGSVLEALVSRTRFISQCVQQEKMSVKNDNSNAVDGSAAEMTRIIGLSTALANPTDLADWMGINVKGAGTSKGLYNFRPSVRPIPMEVHIQGFPGRHYCPRMATMNKPCYAAIKEHSPTQPVIIFVSSRRQTRLTALGLISYAAGDLNPRVFLGCDDEYIEALAATIMDASLRHTLTFGIGLHHAGLSSKDRDTVERLFLNGEIKVLVATATLAWGVNLPAHLVIVKGTEYFDAKTSRYVDYPVTDVLQMMGRAGRPQFDTEGIACIMVAEDKKNFYKKFLYDPFPVESCLADRMEENFNAEVAIGTINSVSESVGYLTWTYFARRVKMNPSYYGAKSGNDEDVDAFFLEEVKRIMTRLEEHGCVKLNREDIDWGISSTVLGRATSNFYLNFRTPLQMRSSMREIRQYISQRLESTNIKKEQNTNAGQGGMAQSAKKDSFWLPKNIESEAVSRILLALSWVAEFDEHPVRHNEEELNASLSDSLPWGPGPKDALTSFARRQENYSQDDHQDVMADPHTKCFLLIQAYLVRAKLPISDYINDTKSVMDQIPRILAAMQYVTLGDAHSSGSLDVFCLLAKVRQVLDRRSMVDEDPLNQIPFMPKDGARRLKSRGTESIGELCRMGRSDATKLLRGVLNTREKDSNGGSSLNIALNFLDMIPLISMERPLVTCEADKVTGKSTGYLKFDLLLEGSRRTQKRRRKETDNGKGIPGTNFMVALGCPVGRCLLANKTVHFSAADSEQGIKKNMELKFDWNMANAGGGNDGGHIILRILCEDIKGIDIESLIPLR